MVVVLDTITFTSIIVNINSGSAGATFNGLTFVSSTLNVNVDSYFTNSNITNTFTNLSAKLTISDVTINGGMINYISSTTGAIAVSGDSTFNTIGTISGVTITIPSLITLTLIDTSVTGSTITGPGVLRVFNGTTTVSGSSSITVATVLLDNGNLIFDSVSMPATSTVTILRIGTAPTLKITGSSPTSFTHVYVDGVPIILDVGSATADFLLLSLDTTTIVGSDLSKIGTGTANAIIRIVNTVIFEDVNVGAGSSILGPGTLEITSLTLHDVMMSTVTIQKSSSVSSASITMTGSGDSNFTDVTIDDVELYLDVGGSTSDVELLYFDNVTMNGVLIGQTGTGTGKAIFVTATTTTTLNGVTIGPNVIISAGGTLDLEYTTMMGGSITPVSGTATVSVTAGTTTFYGVTVNPGVSVALTATTTLVLDGTVESVFYSTSITGAGTLSIRGPTTFSDVSVSSGTTMQGTGNSVLTITGTIGSYLSNVVVNQVNLLLDASSAGPYTLSFTTVTMNGPANISRSGTLSTPILYIIGAGTSLLQADVDITDVNVYINMGASLTFGGVSMTGGNLGKSTDSGATLNISPGTSTSLAGVTINVPAFTSIIVGAGSKFVITDNMGVLTNFIGTGSITGSGSIILSQTSTTWTSLNVNGLSIDSAGATEKLALVGSTSLLSVTIGSVAPVIVTVSGTVSWDTINMFGGTIDATTTGATTLTLSGISKLSNVMIGATYPLNLVDTAASTTLNLAGVTMLGGSIGITTMGNILTVTVIVL